MAASSNPLAVLSGPGKLQDKPKQLKEAFDKWIAAQPPWVDGMSQGFFGAFQGAFLGTLMGTMTKNALEGGQGAGTRAIAYSCMHFLPNMLPGDRSSQAQPSLALAPLAQLAHRPQ